MSADVVTRLRFLCYDINCEGKKKIEVSPLTVHSSCLLGQQQRHQHHHNQCKSLPKTKRVCNICRRRDGVRRQSVKSCSSTLYSYYPNPPASKKLLQQNPKTSSRKLIPRVPPLYYSSVFLRFRAIPVTICRQYNDHYWTGRLDKSRVSKTISGGLSSIASPHQFDCRPRPRPRRWV